MALQSSRKTNIRHEYDHAGGDNELTMKNKQSTFGEESRLNVEMVEKKEDQKPNTSEHRYLGGLLGNKEIFGMVLLALSSYLISGEYAQMICTALTSVPPAVFSYRVLMSLETTREGYHTILFYWTLYGLFALVDQFVGTAHGYNLCKAGLLVFVFLHAVRSNWTALPDSWKFFNPNTADPLTHLFSRSVFEENALDSLGNLNPITPTVTHFSDDSEFMFPEETSNNYEMSTAFSFTKSPEMQSTQRASKLLETPQLDSSPAQNGQNPSNHFETMSAMTKTCGGPSDIITVPADHITFSASHLEGTIQVTNVSTTHIMFALKTNADTYLVAAPTSGVLLSGQSMMIRVGVNETFYRDHCDIGAFTDKLAIDYTTIPSSLSNSISKFSLPFFQSHNRHRHAIRVFYQ